MVRTILINCGSVFKPPLQVSVLGTAHADISHGTRCSLCANNLTVVVDLLQSSTWLRVSGNQIPSSLMIPLPSVGKTLKLILTSTYMLPTHIRSKKAKAYILLNLAGRKAIGKARHFRGDRKSKILHIVT